MSEHSAAGAGGGAALYGHDDDSDEVMQSSHPGPDDAWISSNAGPYDASIITHLFESESQQGGTQIRHPNDALRPHLNASRQDSINWMLKVHAHYHFNPVTALLSVNYFDRFLSSYSLPAISHPTTPDSLGSGWAYQLLSVACLSLATKMEEPTVPLLLDLQIMEPTYVFDPRTVQRMELLVMAGLDWKLCSVTPFDFLDYFVSKLPYFHQSIHIASAFSSLVMNTIRVVDFLRFPPSVIAAAAVILATGNNVELPDTFYERVNKEMVRSCHQLMEAYMIDTCPSADLKARSCVEMETELLLSTPPSPVGVLDSAACVSCDTRSENPSSAPENGSGSGAGELHEPEYKRLRR
ncbi:OLC1v1002889C1 [Oldenlandia corymbosa var. corymbosa]|uniref:OLC1v1002889C1 n=1 Tax=Oldenlandia corymbosa var. corymbosa TaxID=529605 RepID=A0AAV1D8T1_OLDCO|nr:OLC1v1002889C1 [Oldenlandia corymbosa var. corymbosa]